MLHFWRSLTHGRSVYSTSFVTGPRVLQPSEHPMCTRLQQSFAQSRLHHTMGLISRRSASRWRRRSTMSFVMCPRRGLDAGGGESSSTFFPVPVPVPVSASVPTDGERFRFSGSLCAIVPPVTAQETVDIVQEHSVCAFKRNTYMFLSSSCSFLRCRGWYDDTHRAVEASPA